MFICSMVSNVKNKCAMFVCKTHEKGVISVWLTTESIARGAVPDKILVLHICVGWVREEREGTCALWW